MYGEITFPGLGLAFNPGYEVFSIGSVHVRWYGLIIAVGMCLAALYACRRTKEFGLKEDDIIDGILWIVPIAIICARLYYVLFSWDQYKDNFISVLYIWEGGLAIYGGVIAAFICLIVFCKIKKINFWAISDLVSLGFMIGQCIGRWGNFFNREAFGSETDTFLKMGLQDYSGAVTYYHPTFLYESLWNLVGFIALHIFSKRPHRYGQIFFLYLFWYGLGRFWIEGLRTDSLYWFGSSWLRVSQVVAIITAAAALAALIGQEIYCRQNKIPRNANTAVKTQKPEQTES